MKYKKDQIFLCNTSCSLQMTLVILAIEQNYIMCRFKGCVPFVKSIKEFPMYLETLQANEIVTKAKAS